MSGDIVAFIRARLDEDEQVAHAAFPGPWRYNPRKQWLPHDDKAVRDTAARLGYRGEEFVGAGPLDETVGVAATGPADDPQSMADAAHIARHDPARVLREVEAKRRLLKHVWRYEEGIDQDRGCGCDWDKIAAGLCQESPLARIEALRDFAVVWSDHPEYRPEWRP